MWRLRMVACVAAWMLLATSAQASKLPDLKVASVDVAAANVVAGGSLGVRVTVRNAGGLGARGSRIGLRVAGAPDQLLHGRRLAPLHAHRRTVRRAVLVISSFTVPGRFRIVACADVTRRVAERDERNNCRASRRFSVTTPPALGEPLPAPVAVDAAETVVPEETATATPTASGTVAPADTPTPATPTPTPPGPDAVVTNPIVSNGQVVGGYRLEVSWTGTNATFTARAPITSGFFDPYRVRVCLSTHALGAPPVASCVDQPAGTNPQPLTRTIPRPPSGGTTWGTGLAMFGRQSPFGGAPEWLATSWPPEGLSKASIVIPDLAGVTPGPAPSQGAAPLPGVGTGGLNTALPDSLCTDQPQGDAPPPPGLHLSTTALGPLPWYYEVGAPTGAYAGQAPKGIVMFVHGGGWTATGAAAAASHRADAERWRAKGWRTVNTSYRACHQAPGDVLATYDAVRATYGTTLPVCALGASAGGHLVLYLAARRTLYCVVSQAGPGDLISMKDQTAYEPTDGSQQTYGGKQAYNIATAAFGEENLAAFSPQLLGISGTRVLFAIAATDPLVPPAQAAELRNALHAAHPNQYVDALVLPVGEGAHFVHGPVAPAGIDTYLAHEDALIAPLG